MNTRVLYLNNHGSRWIIVSTPAYEKLKITFTQDGKEYTRTPRYFEACGNYVCAVVSLNGKRAIISEFKLAEI